MSEGRVIFINRVYWPATEATAQLLADLAEGLVGLGWSVHVIAAGEGPAEHRKVTIHRTGTPEHHRGLFARAANYRHFLRTARTRLESLVRPGDIVIPLTDPPTLGTVIAGAVAGRDVHVVQWIQDIYPEIAEVHFGPLSRLFLSRLRRRRDEAWRSSAACVTLGEDMRRAVLATGTPPDQITLIPNWAPRELDEPAPADEVAAYRERWNAGHRLVVAYAGNLGRVHEFATILAAAETLRADDRIVFRFIGRGPQWSQVARAVQKRGLTNVAMQPGVPREELRLLLAAADAHLVTLQPRYGHLVYPSKLAGVLAAGRPALFIGPLYGDIARLLHGQDCGQSFAPGSAWLLAETLQRWSRDRFLLDRLGQNARRAYTTHFTYAMNVARWQSLLHDLKNPE